MLLMLASPELTAALCVPAPEPAWVAACSRRPAAPLAAAPGSLNLKVWPWIVMFIPGSRDSRSARVQAPGMAASRDVTMVPSTEEPGRGGGAGGLMGAGGGSSALGRGGWRSVGGRLEGGVLLLGLSPEGLTGEVEFAEGSGVGEPAFAFSGSGFGEEP